jgi:hypothetical protein
MYSVVADAVGERVRRVAYFGGGAGQRVSGLSTGNDTSSDSGATAVVGVNFFQSFQPCWREYPDSPSRAHRQ